MLSDSMTLWPGGPTVVLADYFIAFKYAFSIAFLAWAIGFLRWSNRWWLFYGSVLLASIAWVMLDLPLARPYGVIEGERGLYQLAQPMVAAARGTPTESWMVHQPNPYPLWSLVLAMASGFDPGRLLSLYGLVPLVGIMFLAWAVYWSSGALHEQADSQGLARALGVFFVLFLSSSRLSFLQSPGPFWTEVFGFEPRLAFTLGLLVVWVRVLGQASRIVSFLLAGVIWSLLAWMEPRIAAYAAFAALGWITVSRKRSKGIWKHLLSLAVGLVLFLPWTGGFEPARVPSDTGTWYFAFNRFLSLTLDKGLVFYLALLSLFRMVRSKKLPELLFAVLVVAGFALWTASSLSGWLSALVAPRLLGVSLSLLLAIAAGHGAYHSLRWLDQRLDGIPADVLRLPRFLEKLPLTTLGTAALVALSLPWCFPYWWQPVLMDRPYAQSLKPIAPQFRPLAKWIEAETDPDAVFVAGPSYSPWIPALSGRRVLLVERADPPADLDARRLAESWVIESREPAKIRAAASRWSLTHLAWGRLDAERPIDVRYQFFERSPDFSLVWQQGRWIRVFSFRPQ